MAPMAGTLSFSKDDQHVTITYSDTGFMPTEVSLSGDAGRVGSGEIRQKSDCRKSAARLSPFFSAAHESQIRWSS